MPNLDFNYKGAIENNRMPVAPQKTCGYAVLHALICFETHEISLCFNLNESE